MRRLTPLLVASAAALLLLQGAPAARADVLVSRPSASIRCGDAIKTGVWHRDFATTAGRRVTIEIRSAANVSLWRRKVTATGEWRYFRYAPSCGRHYRVRYVTSANTTTFRVWVRKH